MVVKKISFSRQKVSYYFDASFANLKELVAQQKAILITDEIIYAAHQKKFAGWQTIVLKAGEQHKVQATVDDVINQLIELKADRQSLLIGVGGGVITDLTGYAASVFLRGIAFGFIPTTVLAMVDASIGGKNGIDVGPYKNMVGTINQPRFLLYDASLLKTLPDAEWQNGFAEIIKHAAIKDAALFRQLEASKLSFYQKNKAALQALIQRNVMIKSKVVQQDEFENGERRLLNFGHTLAHAIETPYALSHGQAVAIGMCFAAKLSEDMHRFSGASRLSAVIEKYGLPTSLSFDRDQTFNLLISDKKKDGDAMNFVLLQKIGTAFIEKIPLQNIHNYLG